MPSYFEQKFLHTIKNKLLIRILIFILTIFNLFGCVKKFANKNPIGEQFPSVKGQSLNKNFYNIPEDFFGEKVLFLIGFLQNTQFDIDRWTIGLDQTNITVKTYELPATQGIFPIIFKTRLDDSMRSGIPNEVWGGVITIYKDGQKIQKFTGNKNSNNTRVVLIDENGRIIFFHDSGFSIQALNGLKSSIQK